MNALLGRPRLSGFEFGLVLATGLLGFWFNVYTFGLGNHFEQLPGVLKWLERDSFARDFEVLATVAYGARFYFYAGMAGLAHWFGLWQSYLGVAVLLWLAWAFAIWNFSRRTLELSISTSLGILALLLAGAPFEFGATSSMQGPSLIPASVVWPLLVIMLDYAYRDKWTPFLLVAGVAMLFHPITVAGAVAILTATATAARLLNHGLADWKALARPSFVLLAFVTAYLLLWYWPLMGEQTAIPNLSAMLQARAPQHYSPAFFWRTELFSVAWAFLGFGAAGWGLRRLGTLPARSFLVFAVCASLVTVLCWLVGVIGVEVLGSGLLTALQVFRFSFLTGWIGTVLVGAFAGACLERQGWRAAPWALLLLGGYTLHDGRFVAAAVGFLAISQFAKPSLDVRSVMLKVVPMVVVGLLFGVMAWKRHLALVAVLGTVWLAMRHSERRPWLLLALCGTSLTGSLLFVVAAGRGWPLFPPTTMRLEDHRDPLDGAANYARLNTRKDDLFLTPPFGERFRLVARRSIVVGALGFPNRPELFLEWEERMRSCYGSNETVREAVRMANDYRAITDEKLRSLATKYGCEKAVLAAETPTTLPVVYADSAYKIVVLGSVEPSIKP